MQAFFYYSGIVAWVGLGIVGVLAIADVVIEWVLNDLRMKRAVLEFAWDRMKKRRGWREPEITTRKNEL
jgi:hypothetical protein